MQGVGSNLASLGSLGNAAVPTSKFQRGEIVYLKSGGPKMTVTTYDEPVFDGRVYVEWFAGDLVQRDAFHEDCLTR